MKTILFRYKEKYNLHRIERYVTTLTVLFAYLFSPVSAFSMQVNWSAPLKKCWVVPTPNPTKSPPASDNEHLFLSTSKGSVIALNQKDGSVRWEADFGGNIRTGLLAREGRLLVAASFGSSIAESKTVIREIDSTTGVPFWQSNLEPFSIFNSINWEFDEQTLVSSDGIVVRLNNKGKILWEHRLPTNITTNAVEIDEQIVFGTSGKTIVFVDAATGKLRSQLNSNAVPTYLAGGQKGPIFAGDDTGRISAYVRSAVIPSWIAVTGAAISDIFIFENDLIVSSNDNFVYKISGRNGDKLWKRKLSGRIIGSTLIDGSHAVFLTTGSGTAVILDLEDGSFVNKIDLDTSFVSGPVTINGGFAAPGENAITAVTNNCEN